MAGEYLNELEAVQRWMKTAAGLNSVRLKEAPPAVARPVIMWESTGRGKDRNLGRYTYVNKVTQYGKLYAVSVDQLQLLQEKLLLDLEEKVGLLPVYRAGEIVTYLKNAALSFSGETLDVNIQATYEVTYGRTRPAPPPAPASVTTTVITVGGKVIVGDLIPGP